MAQTVKTHMYLTPELMVHIERIAAEEDVSRSQVVRGLMKAGLDHCHCHPISHAEGMRDNIEMGKLDA